MEPQADVSARAAETDSQVRVFTAVGVSVLEINNPPVNTLSNPVLERVGRELERLRTAENVRAVIITGSGKKAFASGADLNDFCHMLESDQDIADHTALTRRTFDAVEGLPQPVIAALQASAVGGGLELALCCDVIVADERALLGLPEVTLGLMPGAGGTQRLPSRVSQRQATRLVLSGDLISAEEAAGIGLVDIVVAGGQAYDRALGLATRLAGHPMVAVQTAKRVMRESQGLDRGAGLDVEHAGFLQVLASADAREGVAAFLERRRPTFIHS